MAGAIIRILLGVLLLGFGGSAAAERMAVSVKEANVRSAPQPNADVLWKVEKYHPVDVLEASGVWLRFKDYEGDGGWIHKT
ncbi:MAG: SH3 domain-containing protein, partial [Desulfobacterales bacterium]|nr:SH3 domain-containing protein [Desulfobacterales bacterium]